jgi:signal transduction histidine kinase
MASLHFGRAPSGEVLAMTTVISALQYAVAAAFLLLGLSASVDAARHRDRPRIYLALGLVLFSLVPTLGLVHSAAGGSSAALQLLAVLAFLGSGSCIFLFRTCFVPIGRPGRLVAAALPIGAALLAGLAGLPPHSRLPGPLQGLPAEVLILTWVALIGEPAIRFWLAARDRPAVERRRLRGLSAAFAVLVAILLVGTVAGSSVLSVEAQIVMQVAALAMVPILYRSLGQPGRLPRRPGRDELDEPQQAIRDLLVFSPDRATAARRAVHWAARLVGADAAFILDRDGQPLAQIGMPPALLSSVSGAWQSAPGVPALSRHGVLPRSAILLALPMSEGPGLLGALPGPFTSVFGTDEVGQLRGYAFAVAASLERVEMTERLTAMERTKGEFLNLASHELRGPVAIIRGYLAMLERGTLGPLNQAGVRAVHVMSVKAVEMHGLIEQMLDAARLEEGQLQLNLRPRDVETVVERALDTMRLLTDDAHPLVLRRDGLPLSIPMDTERVQTILTNLIGNAIKYSPAGGAVDCCVSATDTSVQIAVRDRGIGIADADLPLLFARFGRISTEATKDIPGVGLGLYLARELARLHGGDITVESRPGVGSTFVLALPRAES